VKVTADTSVLVAAFASWHEHHDVAFAAAGKLDAVVAHCLLETYSVLTRLPAPHRMTAEVVTQLVDANFAGHELVALPAADHRKLVLGAAALGITGGAIYDALIAAACSTGALKVLTLDARARQTYAALGVAHELLA
jgi:predicted nucleic acid-binding protein